MNYWKLNGGKLRANSRIRRDSPSFREEQHDDQILHELLRCFKALSTSTVGCAALRSFSPTPFAQLVSLLYSDKKPGDVASRQLIVELILILFELYPPSSLPSTGSPHPGNMSHTRTRSLPWENDFNASSSNLITLPAPHSTFFSFIRALLLTPAPPPSENPKTPVEPHSFIEELHIPRIYKTYLQELGDVCRDYFWVFCHPNNTVWSLEDVDEGKVERPRAPGGMTGGVEFEAMSYMVRTPIVFLHLYFLRADDDFAFHSDYAIQAAECYRQIGGGPRPAKRERAITTPIPLGFVPVWYR